MIISPEDKPLVLRSSVLLEPVLSQVVPVPVRALVVVASVPKKCQLDTSVLIQQARAHVLIEIGYFALLS